MLRITDIQNNKVNWDEVPYCEIEDDKKKQYLLEIGDLLFARTGATVGKSFLVREIPVEAVYASYLIRVRCHPENSIEYLALFFQSDEYWSQITEFASGIAQPSVNGTKLGNLLIPIPSIEEQKEIVRHVEELFTFADSIEQEVNVALDRVNSLPQSILVKAFQGNLTADWREANPELISGENSAEALLRKIKIERKKLENNPKVKSRTTTKKKASKNMSSKIITVTEALIKANKPLSGQQLLNEAGYPNDSTTEELEKYFLDIREALSNNKIIKLERDKDQQDWFALAETTI